MPKITKEEVQHLAKLSRLNLSEEETDKLTCDLEDILNYMDILNEIDTSGVKENAKVIDNGIIARNDESNSVFLIGEKVQSHRLQKESPEKVKNSLYKVPSSHEK